MKNYFQIMALLLPTLFPGITLRYVRANLKGKPSFPIIAWQLTDTSPETFKTGVFGVNEMTLELSVYHNDVCALEELAMTIKTLFNGTAPGPDFTGSRITNEVTVPSNDESIKRKEFTISIIGR